MPTRSQILALVLILVALPAGALEPTTHWGRDRSVDIESIVIDLAIDIDAGRVEGTTTLDVRGLREGTTEAVLDAVEFELDAVRVNGRPVEADYDDSILLVPFDPPLGHGQTARIEVDYAAEPRAGLWFVREDRKYPWKRPQVWSQGEDEDNRRWFPVQDQPNERMRSETRIRVAQPLKVVANGDFVGLEEHADGTWTWIHRLDFEHVPYLVSIAVGEWETIVEDWDGVALEYHVPKRLAEHADRSFRHTKAIMAFLSEYTGVHYPWSAYRQTCVDDYIFGGMENITASTLGTNTLHDERAHLDWRSEGLVAHEAAHQWFGDYVTCRDWSGAWLNEGFATYFGNLAVGHVEGPDEFVVNVDSLRKSAISADEGGKRRPVETKEYAEPFDLFDGHAYAKGAMILHALRRELGDASFRDAIHSYLETCGGRSIESQDLEAAIEEATGHDVSRFFAQWVHGAGQPELEVSWKYRGGQVAITVEQAQERSELVGLFDLPLDLRIVGEGWTLDREVRLSGAVETFSFETASKPQAVLVDPDGWLLRKLAIDRSDREAIFVLRTADALLPRIEAARDLKEKARSRKVAAALIEALGDEGEHWSVRKAAAEALAKGRGEPVRSALLRALEADASSKVRTAVAKALGEHDADASDAALRQALSTDRSYKVRSAAARSIGKLGRPGAAATLERALSQVSHRSEVLKGALDGLETLEAPRLRRLCERWSAYGVQSDGRSHAIAKLAALAKKSEDETLRKEVREKLTGLLDDPLYWTVNSAITGLGEIGDEAARSALEGVVADAAHSRHRRSARAALEKLDAAKTADPVAISLKAERKARETLERRVEDLEEALAEKDDQE